MPRKILVVDNDEKSFDGIEKALHSSGSEMTVVDDRWDTLSLAKETRPDVIILSLEFFQQGIIDMVAAFKSCLELSPIHIFLISSGQDNVPSYPLGLSGVQCHLRKPFLPRVMMLASEKVFTREMNI